MNINTLIKLTKLSKQNVSELLYPDHRYPYQALWRVCRGDGELSMRQYMKLLDMVHRVSSNPENGMVNVSFSDQKNVLYLSCSAYRALHNHRTGLTAVWADGEEDTFTVTIPSDVGVSTMHATILQEITKN